ncbi:MAG: transporter substrate-binding domain-containing protein, partial [Methylococcales bacterium]|nr:transporter substrate-binding domain-containing protein [Methylococcales bacterium]
MIRFLKLLIGCLCSVLLSHCDSTVSQTKLEKIKQSGVLHVLTRTDPTTYYQNADGYAGLEYDLITLFAQHLGVKAEIAVPDTFEDILSKIAKGEADIAAAGLTITDARQQTMRFAPAYHDITEQLIYRSGTRRPADINSLTNGIIEVTKGTSHVDTLKQIREGNPTLGWEVNDQLDTNGLLYLVNEGLIDYTVADSNQSTLIRRFYPKLNIAFDISPSRQ